jgi:hypothetical protein
LGCKPTYKQEFAPPPPPRATYFYCAAGNFNRLFYMLRDKFLQDGI